MQTLSGSLQAAGRRWGFRPPSAAAEPEWLAFESIVADPGLLARLPRDQAKRLAMQAERSATTLIKDGARSPAEVAAREAAPHVLRSIRSFNVRDDLLGGSVDDMIGSVARRASNGLGGLIATLERESPRPGEMSANHAMEALLALEATGVRRLDQDSAEILMLAACRHAARCLRGDAAAPGLPAAPGAPEAALRIAGAEWARRGTLPLKAPKAASRPDRADQLVELWRDGTTIADQSDTAERRPWEDARDAHAFGAVWLMPSILSALVPTEAERLARDARAAALFVVRCRTAGSGVVAATEAARAVLVVCGEAADPLRLEVPPVRASPA